MSTTAEDGCFETKAIHAGYDRQANADAVSVPIYASAAFDLENARRGDALAGGELSGFEYSRVANPTVDALERRLAALEGGVGAVALSSGMAAVTYALMCVAEGGGRIIAPVNLYGASVDALGDFLPKFGIYGDFVSDINDLAAVEAAIGDDTKAIYTESVANPSTAVADIEGLAQVAHRHGIPLIVDNTVPTPYLLRPIEFGADVVVHSTTKGITGHGNALAVWSLMQDDSIGTTANSRGLREKSWLLATNVPVHGKALSVVSAIRHSSNVSVSSICVHSAQCKVRSMRICS